MKEKGKTLKIVFLEYLISAGVALLAAAVVAVLILNSLYMTGVIIPANGLEQQIMKNKEKLASSQPFDDRFVPAGASYLFISKGGEVLKTSMTERNQAQALEFHASGESYNSASDSFMEIVREDGYCIIHYSLLPHYTSAWMQAHMPSVNLLLFIMIFVIGLLSVFAVTVFWAKYVARQLSPILRVSDKVGERDLDFEIPSSSVKEFNAILDSMEEMKVALRHSLVQEWKLENSRKEQISALTHDLKTPVAIIQGNAQLLADTELTGEQRTYTDYIEKNCKRIHGYVQALVLTNQYGSAVEFAPKRMTVKNLADRLLLSVRELLSAYQITLEPEIDVKDAAVSVDVGLLERALQNIINNAVEHSPAAMAVKLTIHNTEDLLFIRVMDQGKGFSAQDIEHAKEEFYRGDTSRHSAVNYGIGLFNTDRIMKVHGGELELGNGEKGGAVVTLKLPLLIQ